MIYRHIRSLCIIITFSLVCMAMVEGLRAASASLEAGGFSLTRIMEKCKQAHGYLAWDKDNTVFSINTRVQYDPRGNVVLKVPEIHCYLFTPELKIFTQTMDRLPLTIKIYNGNELGIWHNGKRESDPATISFATFQTLWDYAVDNFPVVVLNNFNHLEYLGLEKINGTSYEKVRLQVNRRLMPVLPHKWYVIYINSASSLIEKALCEIGISEFRGMIQMIEFKDYVTVDSIVTPQKILVFPADEKGARTGPILVGIARDKISFHRPLGENLFDFNEHIFLEQ